MRKLFQYLRILLTVGIKILFINLFFTRKYAKHPEKYPLKVRYNRLRKEIIDVFKAFHIELDVKGLEYLNSPGKKIVVSNHLSMIDPLCFIYLSEEPIVFVGKKEAFDVPILRTALKSIGCIPVDREHLFNQIGTIKDIVKKTKDPEDANMGIFIEGTRNRHPGNPTLEYKDGTAKVCQMTKQDIVPIVHYGTFRILHKKIHMKKYPVQIRIHKPIKAEEYQTIDPKVLAKSLEDMANNELLELRNIDTQIIKNAKLSKHQMYMSLAINEPVKQIESN